MQGFGYQLLGALVLGVGAFLGTYLRKKGENLATKDDLDHLTRIVEDIRFEKAKQLQVDDQAHSMRTAVLERRFQAHQEAFALWTKLPFAAHKPNEYPGYFNECHEWWSKNCLYLEPEARRAFKLAYNYAAGHSQLLEAFRGRGGEGRDLIGESWERIEAPGVVIPSCVALPPLLGAKEESRLEGKAGPLGIEPA